MAVNLKIDGRHVEVPDGSTLLDAAQAAGVEIPTMCYERELGHITSCMICVVKDNVRDRLVPACSAPAASGMEIDTCSEEVLRHRKTALELLLSEHLGDCEAPCRAACPAYMDIPEMLRLIAGGELRKALQVVKEDIPLPGVLGRICPAPCERVCRRKDVDEPVSICMLKRYTADHDLQSANSYVPACAADTGRSVAVIGGGPAGLSTAYFLRRDGHAVVLFEKEDKVGGTLNDEWAEKYGLAEIIEAEADIVRAMGVEIRTGVPASPQEAKAEYDAVVIASGRADKPVEVDKNSFATDTPGVFAAGSAVRPLKMAVMATAHARSASISVSQYLRGNEMTGRQRNFDSRMPAGVAKEAARLLMQGIAEAGRQLLESDGIIKSDTVVIESRRCMQCDCAKKDACRLRDYCGEYGARQGVYPAVSSKVVKDSSHEAVVYERGKCIKCGICVKLSAKEGRSGGLGFVGRGVETRVDAPFEQKVAEAIRTCGRECAEKCPTGALSLKR